MCKIYPIPLGSANLLARVKDFNAVKKLHTHSLMLITCSFWSATNVSNGNNSVRNYFLNLYKFFFYSSYISLIANEVCRILKPVQRFHNERMAGFHVWFGKVFEKMVQDPDLGVVPRLPVMPGFHWLQLYANRFSPSCPA
jgi:hypothetical protein